VAIQCAKTEVSPIHRAHNYAASFRTTWFPVRHPSGVRRRLGLRLGTRPVVSETPVTKPVEQPPYPLCYAARCVCWAPDHCSPSSLLPAFRKQTLLLSRLHLSNQLPQEPEAADAAVDASSRSTSIATVLKSAASPHRRWPVWLSAYQPSSSARPKTAGCPGPRGSMSRVRYQLVHGERCAGDAANIVG
jgi:hypothetical protein